MRWMIVGVAALWPALALGYGHEGPGWLQILQNGREVPLPATAQHDIVVMPREAVGLQPATFDVVVTVPDCAPGAVFVRVIPIADRQAAQQRAEDLWLVGGQALLMAEMFPPASGYAAYADVAQTTMWSSEGQADDWGWGYNHISQDRMWAQDVVRVAKVLSLDQSRNILTAGEDFALMIGRTGCDAVPHGVFFEVIDVRFDPA